MQVAVPHFVVIPTHNRHHELAELLDSLPAHAFVLVIDNASEPPVAGTVGLSTGFDKFLGYRIACRRDEEQPPNLSRLWNVGLDWAQEIANILELNEHYVTVLNDDAVAPPEYFDAVDQAFRHTDAAIVFPHRTPVADGTLEGAHHRVRAGVPVPFDQRMTGWCFTLRGSVGLRADERLRWWCGDNDLEQQAMLHGGTTMLKHVHVGNKYADVSTVTSDELSRQTRLDMDTFVEKWGFRPW